MADQPTLTEQPEIGHPAIGAALLRAAKGHARFALSSYLNEDDMITLQAAVAAGAAVELLIKAFLFRAAPALVAMKGDVHSILTFSGKPGVPGKGYLDCRTITGAEAKSALTLMRPNLKSVGADIDAALLRRNSAVHLAVVSRDDLVAGVRAMCVTVDALLSEWPLAPEEFWGQHLASHAKVLAQKGADDRRLRLEQLTTAAFERLARMRAAAPGVVELLVAERAASEGDVDDRGEWYSEAYQCSVCGYWGLLSGPVARGDHLRPVQSHYYDGWEVDRTWYPEEFTCEVCGLALGLDTLEVAGFPVSEELDPGEATGDEVNDIYWDLEAEYRYDDDR